MLSCKDISHKADEYLEKTLPWHTRLAFKLHLFVCVNCRRYVAQIRLTIKTLAGFSPTPSEPEKELISQLTQIYRDNNKK